MNSLWAPQNGQSSFFQPIGAESWGISKENLGWRVKGTFPPELVEIRVINAQVGMKNLLLCERQRFLFQCLQNGPFEGCRWWRLCEKVLSSLEENKKPLNTSQQVLVVVKSENRASRFDGRVVRGSGINKKQSGVWKAQSCGLQGLSCIVSITLQKSTSKEGQGMLLDTWPGIWRSKGWLECWGCT